MSGLNTRHRGHVKFFNSVKGYGFILPEEPNEDNTEVFVHHTAIYNNGGFKSLAEGELVEYDLAQGPKGLQASNVTGPGNSFVQGDSNALNQTHHRNRYNTNENPAGGYMLDPYYNGGYVVYYGQPPPSAIYNGQTFIPKHD